MRWMELRLLGIGLVSFCLIASAEEISTASPRNDVAEAARFQSTDFLKYPPTTVFEQCAHGLLGWGFAGVVESFERTQGSLIEVSSWYQQPEGKGRRLLVHLKGYGAMAPKERPFRYTMFNAEVENFGLVANDFDPEKFQQDLAAIRNTPQWPQHVEKTQAELEKTLKRFTHRGGGSIKFETQIRENSSTGEVGLQLTFERVSIDRHLRPIFKNFRGVEIDVMEPPYDDTRSDAPLPVSPFR